MHPWQTFSQECIVFYFAHKTVLFASFGVAVTDFNLVYMLFVGDEFINRTGDFFGFMNGIFVGVNKYTTGAVFVYWVYLVRLTLMVLGLFIVNVPFEIGGVPKVLRLGYKSGLLSTCLNII